MKLSRDFLRLNIIPAVLLLGVVLTVAFTFFYSATLSTADGEVVSSTWPRDLTRDFSRYIGSRGGKPTVTQEGMALLSENSLWLQILDEDGAELASCSKPADTPARYKPYELLSLYQYGDGEGSVFVSRADTGEHSYIYLIGFPMKISKITMYVDSTRYNSGKLVAFITAAVTVLLILALTVFFNTVISKNLERIRSSLKAVAARSYTPEPSGSFLREIFDSIDTLDADLSAAEALRCLDEKAREEWLANINHDLKPPLAPIRGYAELLADDPDAEPKYAHYGRIILKNSLYAQQLVDDLNLTYQLQSNMLPLKKERVNVNRFVKELIIDILNCPQYEGREIAFTADSADIYFDLDGKLIRRMLTNVLVNALTHNPPETDITVTVSKGESLTVSVNDNGGGMTPQELEGLFTRYYRGTGTAERPEGSGLGMAIAKQIAEAHGGQIFAESGQNSGTTVTLRLN